MFLYHDIQWSSGTTIGFNAGDGVNYYTVPESLSTDGVLNLDSTSNVGIPGMYIYSKYRVCAINYYVSFDLTLLCYMMSCVVKHYSEQTHYS